jgi:hypothetical protein
MEKVGIFYGHLEYIMAIWYIVWSFGNLVAIRYIFHCFGILCQEKSDNTTSKALQLMFDATMKYVKVFFVVKLA